MNKDGFTALNIASSLEVVEFLLQFEDQHFSNGLPYASFNGYFDIVKFLVEKNADGLEVKDRNGKTALMCASMNGKLEIVEFLLKNNASTNPQDDKKNTALHLAVKNGHSQIAKCLIENGAQLNRKIILIEQLCTLQQ